LPLMWPRRPSRGGGDATGRWQKFTQWKWEAHKTDWCIYRSGHGMCTRSLAGQLTVTLLTTAFDAHDAGWPQR